jgi:hypothetical protein
MQQLIYRFIVCRLDAEQHVLGIFMSIIRSLSTAAAVFGKQESAAAVDRLLMMGIRMPRTC